MSACSQVETMMEVVNGSFLLGCLPLPTKIKMKLGNRHPQAMRGGVVPAGVNHRGPDRG